MELPGQTQQTDLRRFVRTYPHALDDTLIADLTALEGGYRSDVDWRRCFITPVSGEALDRFRAVVGTCFADYRQLSRTLGSCTLIEEPIVIRYDAATSDRPDWFHEHVDAWSVPSASRQVSVVAYLNDVAEGCETEFGSLGYTQRCEKGTILMFPSNFLFEHVALPPRSGPKNVAVSWLHFGNDGTPAKPVTPLY